MDFAQQMDKAIVEMSDGLINKGVRPIVNNVAQYAVVQTPVDTGNARFNWNASLDAPVYTTMTYNETDNELGKFRAGVPSPASDMALREIDAVFDDITVDTKVVYLTNSVDYILALEDGRSAQSQQFARKSVEYAAKMAVVDTEIRGSLGAFS